MKISIEIDLTPEEARSFFGLPDMSGVHQAFVKEAANKMAHSAGLVDLEPVIKTWTGLGGVAQDAIGAFLNAAMRPASTASGPSSTSSASSATGAKAAETKAAKPKPEGEA